jgi:integrase
VGLDVGHVQFTADGLIIGLARSKTDQEGRGRQIGIPFGSTPLTCPVRAVKRWLEAANITEGPVLRGVGRWGHVQPERLDAKAVARVVQKCTGLIGLDSRAFAAHSLRAGMATSAARAGKSERSIMDQTGHRSTTMVRKYIRAGSLFTENAAAGLL